MIELATVLGGVVNTGLSLLEKHIDDPVRRLKARQEYIDELKKTAALIIEQGGEVDEVLTEFIATIHAL